MRVAVLSDVHANLDALEAVLDAAAEADAVFVLGDIVGYGAEPQEVIDRLAGLPDGRLIAGNHDLAVADRFPLDWFNHDAATAARWTKGRLSATGAALLRRLEPKEGTEGTLLVHGSVRDPAAEYLLDELGARASFEHEDFSLCFFGHTHVPTLFRRTSDGSIRGGLTAEGDRVVLEPEARYLVNPGSVGQPRDGDPRAAFLVFDSDEPSVAWRRVEYPVERAQEKIRAAGLPPFLADRLAAGR